MQSRHAIVGAVHDLKMNTQRHVRVALSSLSTDEDFLLRFVRNTESLNARFSTAWYKCVTMTKEWYDPFFSKINWRQLENWLDYSSYFHSGSVHHGCCFLPFVILRRILRILLRYWLTHTNIWHDCTFFSPLLSHVFK